MPIQFDLPYLLALLVLVPIWWTIKPSIVLHVPYLHSLPAQRVFPWWRIPAILRSLVFASAVVAAASPYIPSEQQTITASGVDMMLAVDLSGSMRALDFGESRLAVVRRVLDQFVAQRQGDRIGLVGFGEVASTLVPLTFDYDAVRSRISLLEEGELGDATAIGDALALAARRTGENSPSRIVILLSDGVQNAGQIDARLAAEAARAMNIKVYTIAVGREGPVPIPVIDTWGQKRIIQQEIGIDRALLESLASDQGYFSAEDPETLSKVYQIIDQLEKKDRPKPEPFHKLSLVPYASIVGVVIFMLELLVRWLLWM